MEELHGKRGRAGVSIARWTVRITFLALFVALAFKAAYPPIATPPSNLMLRLDPLSGIYSLMTARSASAAAYFWPAWVLLGLTMLSSRFFCGWICPLGTCFDVVDAAKPRKLRYYEPKGREMKGLLASEKAGLVRRHVRLKYLILAGVFGLGLAGVNLLYFASPLVVMNRSVYYVLLPQIPFLLLALLLLALAYRPRFWCESLCPMGALMSLVSMVSKRLPALISPVSVVKDTGACIDCEACYKSCDFEVVEPFLKRDNGKLRSADCTACGDCVAACPSTGALELQSFRLPVYASTGRAGPRARSTTSLGIEPQGVDGVSSVESIVHANPDPGLRDPAREGGDHAQECFLSPRAAGRLTVDRREFIGSLSLGAVLLGGYGVGLRQVSGPVLRMPGAQDQSKFLAACSRCEECVRTCPAGCIKPMGLEDGLGKLWTPRFYPRTAGCIFDQCDQACARVCPMKAIERQQTREVRIGLAHVNRQSCLGYRGRPCLVCKERCRFNAIDANGLRPVVVAHKCTGCGACEQTCPTKPASIRVFELGQSARWPSGGSVGERRRGQGQT